MKDSRLTNTLFTLSWDDGHPLDVRLSELLRKHGFPATFYIPLTNSEGLPVLSANQIRELYKNGFEVGGHTLDHRYLPSLDDATARYQLVQGKAKLEHVLGESVPGFCYPGGRYEQKHKDMVRAAGFLYARTTSNFHTEVLPDPFAMPAGFQCYPHPRSRFLRNFIRKGLWGQRIPLFSQALFSRDLLSGLKGALDIVCAKGGVFHLWGHSWELEKFDGWGVLDEFLLYAAQRIPIEHRLTNVEVLRARAVLP